MSAVFSGEISLNSVYSQFHVDSTPGLIMLMNRGLQARESLLSTKDPHFQNKAQCKTFHARMSLFE